MLLYEMLAGKSPFDIGGHDMPDQSTEDYLFQGERMLTQNRLYAVYISHTDEEFKSFNYVKII